MVTSKTHVRYGWIGERTVAQEALFYEFSLERHIPADHLLRAIDRFVDLSALREELRPFYSEMGRLSIDPELMIRMLIIGYTHGIRSERRLCEEFHLNLGYRWFCRLGLDGAVPDHSTLSKNRHGRFRESDLLRRLFEATVERCVAEGLVGGEGFAVDGSLKRLSCCCRSSHALGRQGPLPTDSVEKVLSWPSCSFDGRGRETIFLGILILACMDQSFFERSENSAQFLRSSPPASVVADFFNTIQPKQTFGRNEPNS